MDSRFDKYIVKPSNQARFSDAELSKLAGIEKYKATPVQSDAPLVRLANLVYDYLLSYSECKHGQKPSICTMCRTSIGKRAGRWGFSRNNTVEENQILFDEWYEDMMYKLRRRMAQENQYKKDLNYGLTPDGSDARTVTAQSFSKRPLRFGGDDRVLSDQRKFGSRKERASFKHHEVNSDGQRELRQYYGHNERKHK